VLFRSYRERLAALGLVVEGYELERREQAVSSGFTRVTTEIRLRGGGETGRGEDVTYDAADHDDYPAHLGLGWAGSLDGFAGRLARQPLFAREPLRPASRDYRRWAFESAALDLALRQAGLSLGDALGLAYRPVRFVVSTRDDIRPWLKLYPDLEFKLDPTPEWDGAYIAATAATGAVRVVDFKAYYEGTVVENPPDAATYAAVLAGFPEAIVEDPGFTDDTGDLLRGAAARLSFDAPVHSWGDVEALPVAPRFLNIKPSRFGSVRALLDCIERARAAGLTLYGGGQFELGVGRSQIQELASLFYADGPNDVAPMGYNEPAVVGFGL
jgi:L-alanine-DL-glutamate epimerase-like enolase superfamily enzyme